MWGNCKPKNNLFIIFIFIIFIFPKSIFSQENIKIDSLRNKLNFVDDSIKFKVFGELIKEYKAKKDTQAYVTAKQAISFAKEQREVIEEARFIYEYAQLLIRDNKLPLAQEYFLLALNIKGIENELELLGNINLDMGKLSERLGYVELALLYLNQSLSYWEKLDDNKSYSECINQIGLIYWEHGEYEDAKRIFKKIENIWTLRYDTNWVIRAKHNYAIVLADQDSSIAALKLNQDVLALEEIVQDSVGIALSLNNIGAIYMDQDKYTEAIKVLYRSEIVNKRRNDFPWLLLNYNNLTICYLSLKDYPKAKEYISKAKGILKKVTENQMYSSYLHNNYEYFHDQKMLDSALKYYVEYSDFNDSLANLNKAASIKAIKEQIFIKEEMFDQKLKLKERELDILQNRLRTGIIIGIAVLFIALSIVLFLGIRTKQRINIALTKTMKKAQAANEAKSMFLANMSHEIRTPMNGVIGMTDILKQTSLDQTQKEYTKIIETSANNLLTIINDILDFSKIEAGKLDLELVPVNIHEIMSGIGDLLTLKAKDKGVDLITYSDINIPIHLLGDPIRLRQILLNLANNAIKFTDKGEIFLSVKLIEDKEKEVFLLFSVKDTGMGIAKEKQAALFEAFTQADISTTREYGGTGLGLAISSQLVSQMKGQIDVTSEQDLGSDFYFTIPLNKNNKDLSEENMMKLNLSDKSIMIVDDNETNRLVFRTYLEFWNANVVDVEHPEDAANQLKYAEQNGNAFDLILIDFQMPNMHGLDLIKKLRAELKEPFKAILLSSVVTLIDSEEIQEAGFDAGLNKPVKLFELYYTISKVLFGVEEVEDIQVKKELLLQTPKKELYILLAEDNIINQKVAKVNLEQMGHQVDVAPNGQIAIDLFLKNKYDLILMDIQMPVKSGYEATDEIREYEKKNKVENPIFIVAMTAGAMKKDKDEAFAHNMNDYISKPFKSENLVAVLSKRMILKV